MDKYQSKYYNTARLMDEALIILLERKNYEYITVKEICAKAGVHRSTFYLHYETMNDLLTECIEYVVDKMNSKFHDKAMMNKERIEKTPLDELVLITSEYMLPYLEFVKENKKFFVAVMSQPVALRSKQMFNALYDDIFNPIMSRFDIPERDKEYTLGFYLNGIYSVIMAWIENDCSEEIEYISNLIINCVRPYNISTDDHTS